MRTQITRVLALVFFFAIGRELLGQTPGFTPVNESPTGTSGALKPQITTGGSYDAYSGNATRIVNDLTVPGALGAYGLDFTRYWNSNHNDYDDAFAEWPLIFGPSGWSHSWHWRAEYVVYSESTGDNQEEYFFTCIIITFPDGHTTKYKVTRSNRPHYPAPPAPRLGPPYTQPEIDFEFPDGGNGVHDHLCNMAADGSDFWLCRADGGSVHFTGGTGNYLATEVFDPHGFKTTLRYNTYRDLYQVEQEGGKLLNITWGYFNPGGWRVITKVETGGTAGLQRVDYKYASNGGFVELAKVIYQNDPAPGETASAYYTYGTCFGDETEPCNPNGQTAPMLKRADDPRYGGAMTKIRYTYWGQECPPPLVYPWQVDYVPAQPYAIATEKSDEGVLVSQFTLECRSGVREEFTGLGARRRFYFGGSAQTVVSTPLPEAYFVCRAFQLGKVTDFTTNANIQSGVPCPPGVACHRQNYSFGNPRQIWDGLNIMTEEIALDDSGEPGQIIHPDGSDSTYDRNPPAGTPALYTSRMHNSFQRWLFQKKDERNQHTTYSRDARRRVTRIDYADSSYETFEYDNNDPNGLGQATSHRLPSGATETYEYDPYTHLLMRESNSVDGWAARKEYTYDSLGRVETMTDGRARNSIPPAPFTVKMTYNGRHRVTSVQYPSAGGSANPTVHYEYDKYGNCTAIIDELGYRKDYTYDSYRRCTSLTEQVNATGCNGGANVASRAWNWVYDRVTPSGTPGTPGITVSASAHTSAKWRIQIEPEFNAAHHRRATARDYDCNDRLNFEFIGIIVPSQGAWIYDDGAMHRYAYDANGQKRSYIDPKNRETTYDYDVRNRLWKTNEYPYPSTGVARTTEMLYDVAGNKTFVKFPDERTQKWPAEAYTAFGQPRLFVDEREQSTNMEYWPWGPMTKLARVTTHRALNDNSVTEHQVTEFVPDLMGRPWLTQFPDESFEENTYEFGQLKTWRTRKNQLKTINYDARGREVSNSWSTVSDPPPPLAPGITRVWDDANRLSQIANIFSTITYSYDAAGQMQTESTAVAGSGGPREVRYCRYPSGEVSQMTYPNNTAVQSTYTARGQLQGTNWAGGNVSYTYLSDGKVDYEDYGNGVRSDLGYNERGFINLTNTFRQSPLQTYAKRDYWRDDRDRILGWQKGTVAAANPMENGRGDRYEYDAEGQLTRASYQATNPANNAEGAQRADLFHYDALGNRFGWNDVASRGAMWFERRNNKLNQYDGWTNSYPNPPQHWESPIYHDDNFQYPSPPWVSPGNGVTMADGWIVASYNALNQPIAIGSSGYGSNYMWFGYDPLGRCVKRWVEPPAGTPPNQHAPPANSNPATAMYYYYDGWNLVQEGPSSGADRVYVHGNRVDEIVASFASVNNQWLYHHYDARGHCILLTNASGGLHEQYDYDAFGWPYFYTATGAPAKVNGKAGSPSGNRFLFTGREFLSGLRIYDYRNRLYQPELGRFLQPDPKEFGAGDYNLYRYCHNDPINKSDPSGMYERDVHLVLTEFLAVQAGFSREVAHSIAHANQRTDTDSQTSPYLGGGDARRAYHFTTEGRREIMRNEAFNTKSADKFGRYLHALQDSYSHQRGGTDRNGEPYGANLGHLGDWHAPDKTANRPELADKMAKDTYNELRQFYQAQTGKEAPDNWDRIRKPTAEWIRVYR